MSSYRAKLEYIKTHGDDKAYPPDPTQHNVMDKPVVTYHKANAGLKNRAQCNKNIHLEIDDECAVKELLTTQMCSRCFRGES